MQITNINPIQSSNIQSFSGVKTKEAQKENKEEFNSSLNIPSSAYRANYASNLSFTGNAPKIKQAFIITGDKDDIPLKVTEENHSFIVDFDSQAEIVYGTAAIDYLSDNDEFEYDTQIIFPKNCEGALYTQDGKEIPLPENSGILINEGTKAKVKIKKGYPFMIMSKKDYEWYERHSNNASNEDIKNKFLELVYYNSHLYNGEFTPGVFLDPSYSDDYDFLKSIGIDKNESKGYLVNDLYNRRHLLDEEKRKDVEQTKALMDKLYETGVIVQRDDGYVKFDTYSKPAHKINVLRQKGFTDDEIEKLMPVYEQARQAFIDTKAALKNSAEGYGEETIAKMKQTGILHNNKRDLSHIYWKRAYGNEELLSAALEQKGFSEDEKREIIENWKKQNKTGYDLSGLKFIDGNLAVYNLNHKLNNWTQGATNWVTNSTAMQSEDGNSPFVGVSMVQLDDEEIVPMSALRKGEKLHSHPNRADKRQTEIYLVTSGAAALNVVKDGKSQIKILKEGDLAVISPSVMHSVNSVAGEYEHVCAQVPSAFQYGFNFKEIVEHLPEDYDETRLGEQAKQELEEYKRCN